MYWGLSHSWPTRSDIKSSYAPWTSHCFLSRIQNLWRQSRYLVYPALSLLYRNQLKKQNAGGQMHRMDPHFVLASVLTPIGIVASIPVILAVELENFSGYTDLKPWNIPETLLPDTSKAAIDHGLIYNLIGWALYRESDNHFLCQHFSPDYTRLSTYDSMLYNGCPKTEIGTPDTELPCWLYYHRCVLSPQRRMGCSATFFILCGGKCATPSTIYLSRKPPLRRFLS